MERARFVGGPVDGGEIAAEALGGHFPPAIVIPMADSFVVYELDAAEGMLRYFFRERDGHSEPNRLPPR